MEITKGQLNLAGWFSILNAVITIPVMMISLGLHDESGTDTKMIEMVLTIISLGFLIYILWTLRDLLNIRYRFYDVDTLITILIWGNGTLTALSILSLWSPEWERAFGILSMITLIPFGILAIAFAIRLLRLTDHLSNLLKPFCYIQIGSGVCYITIILLPLGIIVGVVADVVLGIIFFKEAKRLTLSIE